MKHLTKQQVKDLRRAMVAIQRDTDVDGANVVILKDTYNSVWTQLMAMLEGEEKRLGVDPNSPEWFQDEPAAPLPHPNGRCKCAYCHEGFVTWGDCNVHERSCAKRTAVNRTGDA